MDGWMDGQKPERDSYVRLRPGQKRSLLALPRQSLTVSFVSERF